MDARQRRVLIACERSGIVREAFRRQGLDAWSCDLEPSEDGSPHHIRADALAVATSQHWDILIAHPPCQYLARSGLHWNKRVPGRDAETKRALRFALDLVELPIERKCIENPPGAFTSMMRARGAFIQIIQPHQFGADASKATALVLYRLPPLRPTAFAEPRILATVDEVDLFGQPIGVPRWSNQTDSGQNRLPQSPTRAMERARTYPGVAHAMAEQWSNAA